MKSTTKSMNAGRRFQNIVPFIMKSFLLVGACLIANATIAQDTADGSGTSQEKSPGWGQTERAADTLYINLEKLLEVGGASIVVNLNKKKRLQ